MGIWNYKIIDRTLEKRVNGHLLLLAFISLSIKCSVVKRTATQSVVHVRSREAAHLSEQRSVFC